GRRPGSREMTTPSPLSTITVIVPVRDDAERLRKCLASIRANRYDGDVEIIVADNGSRDQAAEGGRGASAVGLMLPRCRISEARNAAAAEARGEALAFIDADHVVDERWMAAAASTLANPEAAAAGAPCYAPGVSWVQRAYDRFRLHRRGIHEVDWLGS